MNNKLARKIAVVTGSTSGIGEAIARRLAAEGAMVVISGRRTRAGEKVAESINEAGGQAVFIRVDLALAADCDHLINGTAAYFGGIDILVNNAASVPRIPFEEITSEQWDYEFQVNLRSAFLCSRAAVPYLMKRGGGSIVNIGSTMAYARSDAENLQRLAYASAKGGMLTMTKSMAHAFAAEQIRVNWVTVGWETTPGEIELPTKVTGDGTAGVEKKAEKLSIKRLEAQEEIAAGVAYLVSDEASHVTGHELNISGGMGN